MNGVTVASPRNKGVGFALGAGHTLSRGETTADAYEPLASAACPAPPPPGCNESRACAV
jgi:hypothetical protein